VGASYKSGRASSTGINKVFPRCGKQRESALGEPPVRTVLLRLTLSQVVSVNGTRVTT